MPDQGMRYQGLLYRALNPIYARTPLSGEGARKYTMTARRGGAGMIVACVPVPRSAIPGNDYLGIIRVLPIPPCGCRVRLP